MLRKPARLSAALAFLVPVLVVGFGLTALAQSSPEPRASGAPVAGDPTKGQQVYNQNCTTCHGASLEGGLGPALNPIKNLGNTKNPLDQAYLEDVIANGLKGVGGYSTDMPAWKGKLSDQDIQNVSAFIIQQNKIAPGGHLSPADLARSTVTWVTIGILGMLFITWILARYNMRWIARRVAARRAAEGRSGV